MLLINSLKNKKRQLVSDSCCRFDLVQETKEMIFMMTDSLKPQRHTVFNIVERILTAKTFCFLDYNKTNIVVLKKGRT